MSQQALLVVLAATTLLVWAKAIATLVLAWRQSRRPLPPAGPLPSVTLIVPAHNEEVGVGAAVAFALASSHAALELIVVDDGSTDRTASAVRRAAGGDPRVRLLRQPNAGKAAALNRGLRAARHEVVVTVDADSAIAPNAVSSLARHFLDPRVGAVAGQVKVGNGRPLLGRFQLLEYALGQQLDKRALDALGCITVVPGAAGAYRRSVLEDAGGFSADTLAEDMDVTVEIARRGHLVRFEPLAVTRTEAPATLGALLRQRLRWMQGTLQVLWKHRELLFRRRAGTLGTVGLPYALVFGVLLGVLGPTIDAVALGLALIEADPGPVKAMAAATLGAEAAAHGIALRLAREPMRHLGLVWVFRAFYRTLVAYVVLASVWRIATRAKVGWGTLERRGLDLEPPAPPPVRRTVTPVARPAITADAAD